MNPEKLKKLQAEVRIGGKGTQRRKKKVVHTTAAADDKKLQQSLKKLNLSPIPGIEEVNIIRNDGTVINIKNPKTQGSVAINTFAITGNGVERTVDTLPGILPQLSEKDREKLYKKIQTGGNADKKSKAEQQNKKKNDEPDSDDEVHEAKDNGDDDDEVPDLVDDDDDVEVPDLVDDFEAVAMMNNTKLENTNKTE